jgi:2'-5' RNA ligase
MRWLERCYRRELRSLTVDAPGVWHMRGTGAPASDLVRHHAAVFLDPRQTRPVEELRSRWDPVMASRIAAHVTLVYPEEVPDSASLEHLAAAAAASTAPFTISLGPAFFTGSPAAGVLLRVRDPDNGIGAFRAQVVSPGRGVDFPPHVTIVHPRTSGLGQQAWQQLASHCRSSGAPSFAFPPATSVRRASSRRLHRARLLIGSTLRTARQANVFNK